MEGNGVVCFCKWNLHIYIYIHNIGYYIYTVHIGNSHLATSCCLMLFCLMYLCIQTYVNKSLKVKNELSFRMKVKAWVVRLYKHTLVCKCWLHLHASGISVSWDDFGITLQEQPVRTFGRANDCKNSAQKQKHWHYSHIVAKTVNQTMMPFNNNKYHKNMYLWIYIILHILQWKALETSRFHSKRKRDPIKYENLKSLQIKVCQMHYKWITNRFRHKLLHY